MEHINVIHHTPGEFPLDSGFYGQTFVIGNHTHYSSLTTAVSSSRYPPSAGELSRRISEEIAESQFNTILLPKADLPRELVGQQPEIVREKVEGICGNDNDIKNKYLRMVNSWTRNGKVALATHFFNNDYRTFMEFKRVYGDNLDLYIHLHCLADLYLGKFNGEKLTNRQRKAKEDLTRLVENASPKFIAVSDAVKDSFVKNGILPGERVFVIKNGVASDLYSPATPEAKETFRRKLGINASKLVGYVGRLEPLKGSHSLLSLFESYNYGQRDVGFVIASSDGDRVTNFMDEVERRAPKLLDDGRLKVCVDISKITGGFSSVDNLVNTHFYQMLLDKGFTKKPYFSDIITKPLQPNLDVYVHPSVSEAFSLSVLEASMSGVPVIASRVGGIPEIVDNNYGSLIDLEGKNCRQIASDLREAISYWLKNPFDSGEVMRSRENMMQKGFDAKTMAKKMDRLYLGI